MSDDGPCWNPREAAWYPNSVYHPDGRLACGPAGPSVPTPDQVDAMRGLNQIIGQINALHEAQVLDYWPDSAPPSRPLLAEMARLADQARSRDGRAPYPFSDLGYARPLSRRHVFELRDAVNFKAQRPRYVALVRLMGRYAAWDFKASAVLFSGREASDPEVADLLSRRDWSRDLFTAPQPLPVVDGPHWSIPLQAYTPVTGGQSVSAGLRIDWRVPMLPPLEMVTWEKFGFVDPWSTWNFQNYHHFGPDNQRYGSMTFTPCTYGDLRARELDGYSIIVAVTVIWVQSGDVLYPYCSRFAGTGHCGGAFVLGGRNVPLSEALPHAAHASRSEYAPTDLLEIRIV